MSIIRAVIAMSNPLLRLGLHSVLSRKNEIEVDGVATCARSLLELVETTKPDIVLCDEMISDLPMSSAASIVDRIRKTWPCRIFVIANVLDEDDLYHFMVSGASAYESSMIEICDLIAKIRRVCAGEYLICSEILPPQVKAPLYHYRARAELMEWLTEKQNAQTGAEVVAVASPESAPSLRVDISPREIEVLYLVAQGKSNPQIGQCLGISDHTAKNHVNAIIQKFGARDRTDAVVKALRRGLLQLEEAAVPHLR